MIRTSRVGKLFPQVGVLAVSSLLFSASSSLAGLYTLTDGNSEASFETDDTAEPSNQYSWVVDGVEQLYEQAFYYRIGNTAEAPIHGLTIDAEGAFDTNLDGDYDTLFTRYVTPQFEASVRYVLAGGSAGSGESSLGEQITIRNTQSTPLAFNFFQYVDFDLNGTDIDDLAQFVNANAVQQWEPGFVLSESVVTPAATRREIAPYDEFNPNSIRNKLTDGVASDLSNLPAIGTVKEPGDMTWAFQWTFTLAPGATFQITKAKDFSPAPAVPEPSSLALAAMIATATLRRRRAA